METWCTRHGGRGFEAVESLVSSKSEQFGKNPHRRQNEGVSNIFKNLLDETIK